MMQTSELGKANIEAFEDCVLRAYKDVKGVPTIGRGHTSAAGFPKVTLDMEITQKQADDIFAADLRKFEVRVLSKFKEAITQNLLDGSVSFDYNTGAILSASWPDKFMSGDLSNAEISLLSWNKSGGKVYNGLTRRRRVESNIIFRNKYPDEVTQPLLIPKPRFSVLEIKQAQNILTSKGFYKGGIDGIIGPQTDKAVKAYQQTHPNLTADGILGVATMSQLLRDSNFGKEVIQNLVTVTVPVAVTSATVIQVAHTNISWYGVALVALGLSVTLFQRRDVMIQRLNSFFNKNVY